jgi:hypothetical protein
MEECINIISDNNEIMKIDFSDNKKILYCYCPFCKFINVYDADRLQFTIIGENLVYSIITEDIYKPNKELVCYQCKTKFKIAKNKLIIVDNTKIMEKINQEKEKKNQLDKIINSNLAELAKMEEQKKIEEEKAFIEAGKPQNIINEMYKDTKKQEPITKDVISKEDSEKPKKYSFKFIR